MQFSRFTMRPCVCLASLVWLTTAGVLAAADEPRPLFVEGYAGRVSYAPGEYYEA